MALAATVDFDVRTGGSDTNGGGFNTAGSGTDWSQQNAAQYAVTDAVTAGTTTITSASANFGTDVVGNLLYIQGGTAGITAGWYQINSRTNSTTIVVDRSTGLTAGTGATLNIGGSFASPGRASAVATVAGQDIFVKDGTYSITSASTNVNSGCVSLTTGVRMAGYATTHRDNPTGSTRPLLQASGISSFTLVAGSTPVGFIQVDGANLTSSRGITASLAIYCKAINCNNNCFVQSTLNFMCEASGHSTGAAFLSSAGTFWGCYAHDGTSTGFSLATTNTMAINCISESNSGASSDGFASAISATIVGCVAYNNGRDGLRQTSNNTLLVANCIFESNAGYGLNNAGSTFRVTALNNAYYNNTSGQTNGDIWIDSGGITGTSSFFTDAANGNFSLNNTAGGGASARAQSTIGVFPGATTTGYEDVGAVQHADPGTPRITIVKGNTY